ncbi:MAG: hypothetical protein LBL28_02785 [Treponema sp.]|jgi:hypothetical protein|nr:hypothetical protein [Treponema sp.]
MGDIPGGFFSGVEKTAVFEAMAERQVGPDKKGRSVLFFDMRGDENRFMTAKRKPLYNLITDHKNLLRLGGGGCGALLIKGARFAFRSVFTSGTDNSRRKQGGQHSDYPIYGFRHGKPQSPSKAAEGYGGLWGKLGCVGFRAYGFSSSPHGSWGPGAVIYSGLGD